MDQNQRRARAIAMRKGKPLPRTRAALDGTEETTTTYFIQSRPAPGQPWQPASGVRISWESKAKGLERLAARREMQPSWEHRLMERITTVTEQPTTEA